MAFQSIDYTSKVLWHFVRDRKSRETKEIERLAEAILLEEILSDDGRGKLRLSVHEDKFYPRHVAPAHELPVSPSKESDMVEDAQFGLPKAEENIRLLHENKAVCFADIPFGFLPIHMERYDGVGLGFRRKEISDKHAPSLRPVTYYPHLTRDLLEEISKYDEAEKKRILNPYSKVPSREFLSHSGKIEAETFEDIYREREWRIEADFEFIASDLVCVVFRDRTELTKALLDPKIQLLSRAGVSIFCCHDFFFEIQQKESGKTQENRS